MDALIRQLRDVDDITLKEVRHFVERKINEHMKLRGQIARDLRKISPTAFEDPAAYETLRRRYATRWASNKKLAILESERLRWCKCDD